MGACLALTIALTPIACSPRQFTTAILYDTPSAFVRLEADRTVEKGREHSHPVTINSELMAAVLSGIIIEEPLARLPFYDDTSQPRRHRAFNDNTVAFLAPLLTLGLGKATPEEVVTFYQTRDVSGTSREVTSGGLFVQGEELHIVLSNYHSSTHYMADIGVADTTDDRLTPMQSLAPQRGRLDFEPRRAMLTQSSNGWSKFFERDRRELIVLIKQLTPRLLSPSSADSSTR